MHRSTSIHKWIDIHAGRTHTNCRGRKWSAFSEHDRAENLFYVLVHVYTLSSAIWFRLYRSLQLLIHLPKLFATLHFIHYVFTTLACRPTGRFSFFLSECWCYLDRIRALPLPALQSSDSRIRPTSPLSAMRSLLRRLAPACYDSLADKTVLRTDANYLLHCYYSALESNECASIWNAPNPRSLCISYLVASHSSWQSW